MAGGMLRVATAAAVVALALSGCAARSVARPSASPERTTATPTPLLTPSPEPGEVTRATSDGAGPATGTGALPATGQVAVEVACTGADPSAVAWRLETGEGAPLGLSGEADCSAPPTTSWLGITADPRPMRVRIVLDPGPGVVGAWAVVRTGTP